TNFLSGLTMAAIPWIVTGVFCVLLSLLCGGFAAGPLFLTILCVFGEGVFYFSSATAAAFITGNVFALPLLYFLFHFLAPLADALITTFSSNMIFGLSSRTYTGVVDWLSPTVYIMKRVKVNSVYTEIPYPGEPNVTTSVLQSVTLENAWIIFAYTLVGLALLGVAYALYRYRKSECAGEVIAMEWGRPVFRYGISALLALGGGQLLYVIIFNSFDIDQSPYHILPLIFCMLIAGLIGYYGACMLLAKTLRVFHKGTLRGVGIVAAGCVVVCCVVGFDMLGIARRVPSVDSVKYVRLYTANNTYYLFPDEDADVIEQLRAVHKSIIDERDYAQAALNSANRNGSEIDFTQNTYVTLRMSYYLKGGLTVERNYFLFLTKERMSEPGTYDNMVDSFVNSTEMKLRRLRFNDSRFQIMSGNISVQKRDDGFEFSSRELQEILNSIAEDTRAGNWGQYDWFENDNDTYAVQLFFWYRIVGIDEFSDRGVDNITVYLRPGMTRTIDALKRMGYVTDDDLITSAEMRKIWEERARAENRVYNPPDMSGADYEDETVLVLDGVLYPKSEVMTETVDVFDAPETPEAETATPETAPEPAPATSETVPEAVPATPETPETATVTPELAETTEPTNPGGVNNNPNSAPQTPAESSAASFGN
ncbi:MAG: hypothetical protein IJR48_02340, partial [Oscillibacter sp.]|nr:hypothetical protein [Oscillibacter sp.]